MRLEPVAETRLLMQGLNLPNFQALERLLKEKPTEDEAWRFMRGQALLIAENGNLLLMRPPRNPGETMWMEKAANMRTAATASWPASPPAAILIKPGPAWSSLPAPATIATRAFG